MSFKYFLETTPKEDVINLSSLTKFRKLRLKDTDLLDLLINKTVSIAVEKGIIRSKSIIVDATYTLSRSNPYSAIEVLRERSKLLRKTVYLFDEDFKIPKVKSQKKRLSKIWILPNRSNLNFRQKSSFFTALEIIQLAFCISLLFELDITCNCFLNQFSSFFQHDGRIYFQSAFVN